MKLLKKEDSKYIIEEFGSIDIINQLDILSCFLNENDRLLFRHINMANVFNEKYYEQEKDDLFEGFCKGYLAFHQDITKTITENKIMDLLYFEYGNYSSGLNNEKEIKKELYAKFLNEQLNLDDQILGKIQKIIYNAVFTEEIPGYHDFIKNRTVFINNNPIFNENEDMDYIMDVIWYEPKTWEEIRTTIENEGYYTCIVLQENKEFHEYTFAISYYETAVDYDLEIIENRYGLFNSDVLPRIYRYIGNSQIEYL